MWNSIREELEAVCFAADAGAGGWVSTARLREALATPSAQAEPSAQEPAIPAKWLPAPDSPAHKLVSDAEYLRLFEEARKGSDKPSGVIRGIRACVAAYELASPGSASVAAAVQAPAEGASSERHPFDFSMSPKQKLELLTKLARNRGFTSVAKALESIPRVGITTRHPQPAPPEQAQAKQDVQSVPEGFVLVPLVPTMDMYDAAVLAYQTWHAAEKPNSMFTHIDVWNAMLAAAPTSPAQGADE